MFRTLCVVFVVSFFIKRCHSQQNVCGMASLNTKIVGGQNASPGSWPWQVSLVRSFSHFCGGSLINNNWVLSAAHCFSTAAASEVTVYLGLQTLSGTNSNMQKRSVKQIIIHPNYNSTSHINDIALLELKESVAFTDYINSVCLATTESTFFTDTKVWVTGWGNVADGVSNPNPGTLKEVEVLVIGNRKCNCLYGNSKITSTMMCAGVLEGGKDSCQGDSGGPLVLKQGSRWIQVGIVSFGRFCALKDYPGVYTRVSVYQSWINEKITSNQPGYFKYNSNGTDADLQASCFGVPPITSPPTTTPPPVVCGTATLNNVSVGGSPLASAGNWPWMASLKRNGSHVCGGTLIAEQFVMSSADCFNSSFNASEWTVVLGRINFNGSDTNAISVQVQNITLSSGEGNNIAVLKLSSKPTLSQFIRPICVDTGGNNFTINTQCWAAGWNSEVQPLQQFNTTIVSCGNSSSSNSICTAAMPLTQGNKGGALMCKLQNSWIHAAALTLASSNKTARAVEVQTFTKTSTFSSFLKSTVPSFSVTSSSNSSSNSSSTSSSTSSSNTSHNACNKVYSFPIVVLVLLLSVLTQISISE